MDYKRILLLICCFSFTQMSFSQSCLRIISESNKYGVINVSIKNNCKITKTLTIDTSGINMGCSQKDFFSTSFLRMSLCAKLPKNNYYPFGIIFQQSPEIKFGKNMNMTLDEYLNHCFVEISPNEEKSYQFEYIKQDEMLMNVKDSIKIKAKMIIYDVKESNIKKYFSNFFEMELPVQK